MARNRGLRSASRDFALCLLLVAATAAVYSRLAGNGFIGMDDPIYVFDNPQVRRGLTGETALWALSTTEHATWYPATRLSHLADTSLFGMWAGGHHLVSAAWHAGAAALLFSALRMMTGAVWRSAAVAGIFAVHPLQVESVAWAAERSTVLAGFFFGLTLLLWARYTRRPGAGRFSAVLASLTLGLAAKPSLVTLPLLLLVLDWWPLGRATSRRRFGALFLEKVPLLLLAMAAGAVAVVAHQQARALQTLEALPLGARIGNAALSYWRYLGKFFWPADLAFFYPHPGQRVSLGLVSGAGLLLATVTVLALRGARQRPWLTTGWLWYLGVLVPMIGLVQFGSHAMADRFVYLPLVGLALALVWSACNLSAGRLGKPHRTLLTAFLLAVILLAWKARIQVGVWRDSETLYRHSLAITGPNALVDYNLGTVLAAKGREAEAVAHYRRALAADPTDAAARFNLGNALLRLERYPEAAGEFRLLTAGEHADRGAWFNRGETEARLGQWGNAEASFRQAFAAGGGAEAAYRLGLTLLAQGKDGEAGEAFHQALRLQPDHGGARAALAGAHKARGSGDVREPGSGRRAQRRGGSE
jgi:tetratricopeptide (TPR) repeat protein